METGQKKALKGEKTGEDNGRYPDVGDMSGQSNFEMNDVQQLKSLSCFVK